jgi:hypothetical protein
VSRARFSSERGEMGLIQLLVAMSIFAAVLGATLTTFENFDRLGRRTVDRTASQDSARTAVDRLARQLRNLASPTIAQPQAVDRATDYDLVFQTVDPVAPAPTSTNAPNIERVRWCLDQTNPANGKLYMQEQRWQTDTTPTAPPDTVPCGTKGGGWETAQVLASNVTNRFNGQTRPLFAYNDPTLLTAINKIHVDLYSDLDPAKAPNETHITTGVFLRNQNRAPVASFNYVVGASGTSIELNGSASYDPEGAALKYSWVDGTIKVNKADAAAVTYTLPVTPGSSHAIRLDVYDPADLPGSSATITIQVPQTTP